MKDGGGTVILQVCSASFGTGCLEFPQDQVKYLNFQGILERSFISDTGLATG